MRRDGLEAWAATFKSGWDFFADLPSVGVATDEYGRPSRGDALAAWRRLGEAFLADYCDPHVQPWALREFGRPGGR